MEEAEKGENYISNDSAICKRVPIFDAALPGALSAISQLFSRTPRLTPHSLGLDAAASASRLVSTKIFELCTLHWPQFLLPLPLPLLLPASATATATATTTTLTATVCCFVFAVFNSVYVIYFFVFHSFDFFFLFLLVLFSTHCDHLWCRSHSLFSNVSIHFLILFLTFDIVIASSTLFGHGFLMGFFAAFSFRVRIFFFILLFYLTLCGHLQVLSVVFSRAFLHVLLLEQAVTSSACLGWICHCSLLPSAAGSLGIGRAFWFCCSR